jgi:hypothetical protein
MAPDHALMTAPDLRAEPGYPTAPFTPVSPTRLLASALLQLLDRDEPLPPRWLADPFVAAVADHRAALAPVASSRELDQRAPALDTTFRAAVTALASDPLAAALAVRRLELMGSATLPAWPAIVRHGVAPRVAHADQGRWFG